TTACFYNGTYTIGPGGNYTTLSQALNNIKIKGVSGNVVFELLSNYTSSAEVFPIIFPKTGQVPCIGNYKIMVRPHTAASNLIISGSGNNPLFLLDSVHYLTIDGRAGGTGTSSQLSIINNNAAPALRISNASNNKFLYLKLGGGINGSSIYEGVVNIQGSKGSGSDNNKLAFCDIFSAATAPAAKPVLLYSAAANGFENNNDSIVSCNFYDYGTNAISLANYNDGWLINANSFYNTGTINYSNAVSVLKINAPATTTEHQVTENHFGGMSPGGLGNPMSIGYNQIYYCLDISGKTVINKNYFTRMRFNNASATDGAVIRMINIDDINNTYAISNNQFGSTAIEDSLHFSQGSTNINISVTGIYVNAYSSIINNQFTHLRCYSNSGMIAFEAIRTQAGIDIRNNVIGNPLIPNSIVNNSNGSTAGIVVYGGGGDIKNNTICRISANGNENSASLTGIYYNGYGFDSISNNKIFHLKNGNGAACNTQTLTGMTVYQAYGGGGQANLIGGNDIHSMVNDCTSGGGTVIGIHVASNLNVRHNFIRNLYSNNTTNISHVYGILIPDKYSVLENNMVSLGLDSNGNSITAGNLYFAGISGGEVMNHNSVYIGGSGVTDGLMGSACFLFLGNALPTANTNNIYFNARSNASAASNAKHQCANIDISYTSDYNLYYFTGTGAIMGTFTGVRYNDLNAWKASTGRDMNSIFANPRFLTPAAGSNLTNLHVEYGSPVETAGWNANTLATDFDNETRNNLSPVDIGADAGNFLVCPSANAGNDRLIVIGDSTQLGGPPNYSVQYQWVGPGLFSTLPNPIVAPVANGFYKLTISSGSCTSSDTVYVMVIPPPLKVLCPGGSGTIYAFNTGSVYQWQVNMGNGFSNLSNNSNYGGVNTNALQIINMPSSFYGYQYRCIVDSLADVITTLKFENIWTGAVNNLWSNPGNWSCGLIPDGNTDIYISSGSVQLDINGICRSLHVSPGVNFTINPGVSLTITH
ncbi:MAG TPA: hypothetical protein VLR49_11510, partial [Ferruginibacter sp.]|nr:hypothetical protein [Ferruginibacter sp.]